MSSKHLHIISQMA